MLISFLVASEMGSYMGKSSDAEVFSGVEPIAAGKRLTKNSSEAREVLADLYILRERTEQREKFPIYKKKTSWSMLEEMGRVLIVGWSLGGLL